MSTNVYFSNPGTFDPRAMTTFGVSVKEGENPVGYFGTGFKYAVAIILRLGGKIHIHSGGQTYHFSARSENLRGKDIGFVYMNDTPAGFTTHLGVGWEPWQAFRELYCNAKDEGGEIGIDPTRFMSVEYAATGHADTLIVVSCPEVLAAYQKRYEYFLEGQPSWTLPNMEIHNRPSNVVFYRGIRVAELPRQSLFTYNITGKFTLTEDRTAKSMTEVEVYICRAICDLTDHEALAKIVSAPSDETAPFEGRIDLEYVFAPGPDILNVIASRIEAGLHVSLPARGLLKRNRPEQVNFTEVSLTPVQQSMLRKAAAKLTTAGYPIARYKVNVVEGLGPNTMGLASEGQIYLSLLPFNMGTKQVASTLLEEFAHLDTGHDDFSRGLQNWLFDKILSAIEDKTGEAF